MGEPDHAEDKHHSTAMACQAAFPDLEYFEEALPRAKIIFWLIENAVAEPGAYQSTNKKGEKQWIQHLRVYALLLAELGEHPVAKDETRDE